MKLVAALITAMLTVGAMYFSPYGRHLTQAAVRELTAFEMRVDHEVGTQAPSTSATGRSERFADCPQFFVNGISPEVGNAETWKPRALCFSAFAVLHSGLSRTPLFVAERLNKTQLQDAQDEKRTNRFYEEARLPSVERARLTDYKGSGYDRGHMAPAADMPTPEAMAQSFSLANMVPQAQENNRGIWAKSVEKAVRKYVMRASGDVYVITGPVFEQHKSADPRMARTWVPTALFKLVFDASNGKTWAYWVLNRDDARMDGVVSYQELVRRTGIQFFPDLPT